MRLSLCFLFLTACSSTATSEPPGATPPPPATAEAPIGSDAGTDASAPADAAPPARPAKGCSVAPVGLGAVTAKTTNAAGKSRVFHLSVPAQLAKGQPAPLVFVLHGASDTTPANMKDWFGVEGNMNGALVVYPQALARTRKDGSGGMVTRWDLYGDEDTAFFDSMLSDLAAAYCVDRARVFVTGFSSGGNFSQQLACLRQKDVKGMAVVAGPGPYSDTCGGAVPAWMTHDTGDQTLPIADARGSRDFWSKQNGCGQATWAAVSGRPECRRNTACSAGSALVYCESSGVGHGVPEYAAPSIGAFFTSLGR